MNWRKFEGSRCRCFLTDAFTRHHDCDALMPKFSVTVPHQMGREAAQEKLDRLMTRVSEMYRDQVKDIEQSWEGNTLNFSFRTMGMTISGKSIVEENQVDVKGDLPFAAMLFKGKIENDIRSQLVKLLS